MRFKFPTTVTDPSSDAQSLDGNSWFGTAKNDRLIWRAGDDNIDGLKGFDTLVIPAFKGDTLIGNYGNRMFQIIIRNERFDPELPISATNERFSATIAAISVERVKFFDKTINIKTFSDKRRANRRERRQTVAANPRADAALARTPLSVAVFSGDKLSADKDPSSIAQNTPFCSTMPDLF